MRHQQHPNVTSDDVERVVRRDFSGGEFDAVMAILKQYGVEKWHRECPRVQLAALKLANGDLDKLQKIINVARTDYRDVTVPAEYPEYGKRGFRIRELPIQDQERIIDSDWDQYERWLQA